MYNLIYISESVDWQNVFFLCVNLKSELAFNFVNSCSGFNSTKCSGNVNRVLGEQMGNVMQMES